VAAAVNPVMSSWVALRQRIQFEPGQSVLVLGATGSSGRMAIQVAKHLGAGWVIGVGRDPKRLSELASLGTDATVQLDNASAVADLARDVDVVIDYLWGPSTADLIKSVAARRSDPGKPLTWIEIGSVAGPSADIGSAALRAVRLQIVGSGQGSVPTRGFLSEMPDLIREISSGTFGIDARAVPLTEVATAWKDTSTDQRVVLTP
jgi:NADPH:quinone reductase-like Zn-dependent oxidoreductase